MNLPKANKELQREHPSDDTLSALASNRLSNIEIAGLQRHLDRCKRCQTILDEFRVDSSSLGPVDSIPESSPLLAKPSRSADNTKLPLKKSATDPIPVELQNLQLYQVLKRIGRGGMGDVFLVKHKLTGRQEVLKVIHGQLLDRNDVRDRFKREIQSAAKLDHPNVVHTLSAIEEGGLLGLVMEYVPGESLAELVKRTGPLPIDTARDFIRQAACGLASVNSDADRSVHRLATRNELIVIVIGSSGVLGRSMKTTWNSMMILPHMILS